MNHIEPEFAADDASLDPEAIAAEPLEIVFRDEHYIAVNKPAGLLVHRAEMTPRDEPILLQRLRDQIEQYLYPAHRLDRPTSGVIVFGLTSQAAAKLVHLFTTRQIQKHYQALVRGFMDGEGVIDMPLRERFGEDLPSFDESCHPEQSAITHYRSIQRYELPWSNELFPTSRYTLVEVSPQTGRWHQIRRHLKHLSHPIVGDNRHGDHRHNERFVENLGLNRMLLAAMRLDFVHPFTLQPLCLQATRGPTFDRVLDHLSQWKI